MRIVTRAYEDALSAIAEAGTARPDVIVAAGSNGGFLKTRAQVPVVVVSPTGFDVMQALARARRDASRIALVSAGETPPEVRRFVAAYGLDVQFASYQSAQEAEACVHDLHDRGIETIVGPGLVTDLRPAPAWARCSCIRTHRYARPSIRHSKSRMRRMPRRSAASGSTTCSSTCATAWSRSTHTAASKRSTSGSRRRSGRTRGGRRRALVDLRPELRTLRGDGDALATVRGVRYVVHRGPLVDRGVTSGSVLTFQESRAVERLDRALRSQPTMQQFAARYALDDVVGASAPMARVRDLVRRYAKSDATVLVLGESGTGKEMIAQSLHALSARRSYPFVAVNCGAFPEALLESELFGYEEGAFTARRGGKTGLFEAAHRGTLFLDEIGEMPPSLQSRCCACCRSAR